MAKRIESPAEILSATRELFNNTKVKSIRVTRAKFLDSEDPKRIYGLRLPVEAAEPTAPVPFDIDDLDLSDDKILELIKNPTTSSETIKNIRDVIRRIMIDQKANVLHWEGTIQEATYRNKLREFIIALREAYKERNKKLFEGVDAIRNLSPEQQEEELKDLFLIQDITQFSSITKYVRNMSFNNELMLSVSLTKLREQGAALQFIPKENDAVQMILEYPDGRTERFLGLISGVADIEEYGQLTSLSLIVFGFSKILSINKMVTDRAVSSQFAGEITEQLITTWSTNAFAASSISEIFLSIMVNQMAMKPKILGDTALDIILSIERSFILRTLIPRIDASRTLLRSSVVNTRGRPALGLVNRFIQENSKDKPSLEKIVRSKADKIDAITDTVSSLLKAITQIRSDFGKISPPNDKELNEILDLTLLRDQLTKRVSNINVEIGRPSFRPDPREITIEFEFDPDAFTFLFQEIYVPLITMAALRLRQDETKVVARFRGKTALAFDVATRTSLRLFFSQLNTPMSLLDSVKKTAKFFVYENEDNEIICEMPRYNEFTADEGENLDDFIIVNPLHSEIGRQDMNLITRIDTKMYVLISGVQPFGSLTSRQYTDPAVLGRYGLRVTDPIHNPNAQTRSVAALYSALEVTEHNALTRILTANVSGNRKYKLGRLYFIARKSLDQKVGQGIEVVRRKSLTETIPQELGAEISLGEETVVSKNLEEIPLDGYVGYLDSIETTTNYGGLIEHKLSFTYVRKSRLLTENGKILGANFKILPDISALIDALDAALKSGAIPPNELQSQTQIPTEIAEADKIDSSVGLVYVTPDITTADTESAVDEEIELKEVFPLHSEEFVPYKTFFKKGVL